VKEDPLGRLLDHVDNYDRGIHLLVGEQEYRGAHRVAIWLSALVHHCFLADMRTNAVILEPRVDNIKYVFLPQLRIRVLTSLAGSSITSRKLASIKKVRLASRISSLLL
jgi:hypothetical protein